MKISTAMCTYNGARFLPEQLASIAAQTRPTDEMVVCDDGSSDRTLSIVRDFAARATFPVEIATNEVRLGSARNFAKAMSLCTGDVIVLSDQDDVWFPDRLAETEGIFRAEPSVAFVYGDAVLIDESSHPLKGTIWSAAPLPDRDRRRLQSNTELLDVLLRYSVTYGATMALRATYRDVVLPIPEGWSHDEWIALVLSATAEARALTHCPIAYRQHAAQQFGACESNVGALVLAGHRRAKETYASQLARYSAALERFHTSTPRAGVPPATIDKLERKVAHLERRVAIQKGGARGVFMAVKLLASGEYVEFSGGIRSFLKDVAVLLGAAA